MSDTTITPTTTTTAPAPQGQFCPIPPAVTPPTVPTPEQAAAAEQAEREALEQAADATLKAASKAHRRAEGDGRAGFLEAGRLAAEYLAQRLALKHSRDNAVKALAGEWAKYASSTVDASYVNRVVRAWHAHRLLAVEAGVADKDAKAVPYGHYREAWAQLLHTAADGTVVLLPGLEERCKALYREALTAGWQLDDSLKHVRTVQAEYAKAQAAAADAAAAKAKADKAAADKAWQEQNAKLQAQRAEEQRLAAAEQERLQAAVRLEQQAKAAAVEAERQRLAEQAQAEKAEADRLAAEKAQANATANATQTAAAEQAKAADKAGEQAKAAEQTAAKATEQAAKAEQKATGEKPPKAPKSAAKPAGEPTAEGRAPNLLGIAKQANPVDLAAMLYDMLTQCQAPDTALEVLLTALDGCKELSAATQRAVKAARTVLAAKAAAPAVKPSANGTPAPAAA